MGENQYFQKQTRDGRLAAAEPRAVAERDLSTDFREMFHLAERKTLRVM